MTREPEAAKGPEAGPRTSDDALARRINEAAHLTGHFVLRSGATSTTYFDKYRFEADPALLGEVADRLADLVPEDVDTLAGLELGGVPVVTALSARTGLEARFVRKTAKPYGTRRLAEGGDVAGRRIAVVEDVVTSGGAVIASCRALRHLGADIRAVLCVIDREAGGVAALAEEGFPLRALYTRSQLEAAARA